MKYIFLIRGETGEGSDFRTWNVGAFQSEKSASEYLGKLNAVYMQFGTGSAGYMRSALAQEAVKAAMLPLDFSFCEDYNGTYYEIEKVPLFPE
jgi:hypothetical protein